MLRFVTIGSDPEFFISDGTNFIPGCNFIPGSKESPFEIEEGFFIQPDNVLIEGNIPPAETREQFVHNMLTLKRIMNEFLHQVNPSYHVVSADSAKFDPEILALYPSAMIFGCSPYNNVWTNQITKVLSLAGSPWRTAGFHIHIGYINDSDIPRETINRMLVKAFELFVTVPARAVYKDPIRDYYYGELGSYRHTSYGVECRTLGGYFTADNFLKYVYDGTMLAVNYVNELILTNNYHFLLNSTYDELTINNTFPQFTIQLSE